MASLLPWPLFLLTVQLPTVVWFFFFFQAEDGIRDVERSRGLGDVYKRQEMCIKIKENENIKRPSLYLPISVQPSSDLPCQKSLSEDDIKLELESNPEENQIKQENEVTVKIEKDPQIVSEAQTKSQNVASSSEQKEIIESRPAAAKPAPAKAQNEGCGCKLLQPLSSIPVSYTHLTLPTILLVQISVVAVSLKKKKHQKRRAQSAIMLKYLAHRRGLLP
eukprot:TRINITY_DN7742_c0_g1_i1.p1 TRINITY_DN7742_c0_g1~~TRINITY_DN7742_c0_g1_i1.p1  ORF type:complete len:220 (-),score=59.12 TRINITY_DN7742_c0_g1_i1:28-687(-)